jgi:hypothetical protein
MTSIPKPAQNLGKKYQTPQILRGGWYTTWGISLLLLVISIGGVNSQRQAIKTVGKDAAPSVLTAQQLQDSLAGMDASLASELLLKPGDPREKEVEIEFQTNRKKIAARVVAAAKNITYPPEQEIVEKLQRYDGDYLLKLQESRDLHRRGDSIGAMNIYRNAAALMDEKIMPKTEELSRINSEQLEATYYEQRRNNGVIDFFIAIVGLVQIAILIIIQLFLYQRMRRMLNLPLLGATAIAIIFLGYTLSSFAGATTHLKVAKKDAFDSLLALRQMRSLSYRANADESRYLLDRANASQHEQSFNTRITEILAIPPGFSNESLIKEVNANSSVGGLAGFFASSLNNITFAGEKELAIETFKAFNEYLKNDAKIRQLANSGNLAEAISLCIGTRTSKSDGVFDRYRKIHTQLMQLNEKEFNRNIELGNDRLANFEMIAAVALGSVAILTLIGLRPRLAEYL